ncbi:hypothetical protein Pmani_011698 [Petrolisthes manimaculis]|uniref:Uncharacterized protein n=1 Tax=Petrolisthes manimaculis TaxID=1843537 RepID=A0AAE1PZK2_9EUCA|nr:hypothetical protein Pmani_026492 [Petrolisthes manimaculis]KAK4317218.1 hypothetical protein Pmani_011698 [Petrolisthes manimaculis]
MSRLDSEEKEELRNLKEEVATLRQTQATLRVNMNESDNIISQNQDLIEDLRQKYVQLEGIVSLLSNNNAIDNCSRQSGDDPEAQGNQSTLREQHYERLRAELNPGSILIFYVLISVFHNCVLK